MVLSVLRNILNLAGLPIWIITSVLLPWRFVNGTHKEDAKIIIGIYTDEESISFKKLFVVGILIIKNLIHFISALLSLLFLTCITTITLTPWRLPSNTKDTSMLLNDLRTTERAESQSILFQVTDTFSIYMDFERYCAGVLGERLLEMLFW